MIKRFDQWFFGKFFQAALDRRNRITPTGAYCYPWELQERRELYLGKGRRSYDR